MSIQIQVPVISNTYRRIAVSAFFYSNGLCFSSWASRIPQIKENLMLSDGQLGLILLGLPLGSLLSLLPSGFLVERFGSKILLLIAAIMHATILPLIGLSPNIWVLAIVVFFFGMAGNFFNITMNTQAVSVEAKYGRTIMASFHGLWSIAGFSGAAIGALMISLNIIPFYHFIVVSGIAFLILTVSFSYLVPDYSKKKSQGLVFVKPDKTLLLIGIIAFCGMLCEGCMFDWSGVYFQKVVLAESGMVAAGFTSFMSTMALGRFFSDKITNHIGGRKMFMISGIMISIGLLLSVIFPTLIFAVIGFFIVGAGVASVIPLTFSYAGKSTKLSTGVAIALVATIGTFGFLIGPALIGFISEAINLRASFTLVAIMGIMISLLAWRNKSVL
jgi:MFS family permease